MKTNLVDKFKKSYHKSALLAYFLGWVTIIMLSFIEFTKVNLLLIFITFNIADLYLTHQFIFGKGNGINHELNPIARFMMKVFGKYWIIPMFILALSLFYLITIELEVSNTLLVIIGVYIMILINNSMLLIRNNLLDKYNLEMVYKKRE